jgi:hypothetical protein
VLRRRLPTHARAASRSSLSHPSGGVDAQLSVCQDDLAAAKEGAAVCSDALESCTATGGSFVEQLTELRDLLASLTGERTLLWRAKAQWGGEQGVMQVAA